jgi:hypothetical protein
MRDARPTLGAGVHCFDGKASDLEKVWKVWKVLRREIDFRVAERFIRQAELRECGACQFRHPEITGNRMVLNVRLR